MAAIKNNKNHPSLPEPSPDFTGKPTTGAGVSSTIGRYLPGFIKLTVFLMTAVILLFLLLSLASFSPLDPAWSRTAITAAAVNNLGGIPGAYSADILYYIWGGTAWWTVFYLGFILFNLSLTVVYNHISRRSFSYILSFAALMLVLAGSTILEYSYFSNSELVLPAGAGGITGQFTAAVLQKFNPHLVNFAAGLTVIIGILGIMQNSPRALYVFICRQRSLSRRELFKKLNTAVPLTAEEKKITRLKALNSIPAVKPAGVISTRRPAASEDKIATLPVNNRRRQVNTPAAREKLPPLINFCRSEINADLLKAQRETAKNLSVIIKATFQRHEVGIKLAGAYISPGFFNFSLKLNQSGGTAAVQEAMAALKKTYPCYALYLEQINPVAADFNLLITGNDKQSLSLTALLNEPLFTAAKTPLLLALGRNIKNEAAAASLTQMPNLLLTATDYRPLAGIFTALITALLLKNKSAELNLLLFGAPDSALNFFTGLPHTLAPLTAAPLKITAALEWTLAQLRQRLEILRLNEVATIRALNEKITTANSRDTCIPNPFSPDPDHPEPLLPLPYLVLCLDRQPTELLPYLKELTDTGYKVGIHIILGWLATPNTGLPVPKLRTLFPTRLTFALHSGLDSIAIIGTTGAETLNGNDDALLLTPGARRGLRLQTPTLDSKELKLFIDNYKHDNNYNDQILSFSAAEQAGKPIDSLYGAAVRYVTESGKTSLSALQRHLKIGYNRAATLLELMEKDKILSSPELGGKRRILKFSA